ncbi:toxin glutamine deamidase domain-containing protein [Streptomyces viridochromogenes]|uniref:toxin glutamine deamidase domain-containing protein n=1 Tax=Streptomyces viridochromogenes TaxID=1938 RepID=UPI000A8B1FA7|nr:toxin glutamine deamidase domain-containing protein [Streptomyces viridochromogenes]
MMLPDELEWVLEMLGYKWPTANEDKLRDCAAVWREFGEKVNELHTTANSSARQVTAHNAGESIDKFTKTYEKFDGGGGNDGYLRSAAEAAFLIANVLEACAYLVEFAKWAVIAQLIALAIQIAAAAAAAPFTFGLSSVAGMGATQAARLIVRRLLDELKQAMFEALIEMMKEPAISAIEAIVTDLIRQTVNVGFGAQEGYDVGATLKAGGEAGLDALRQSPQTFAEGVRDSLGQKAGSRARDAVDSRIDGYDGPSGSDFPGGDIGSDSSSGSESSNSSSSSDSPSSSDSSSSDSSSSDSSSSNSDSNTSTRSSNGNIPGANIGSGISADTGGNDIPAPNIGAGPDSGPGPGSDSGNPSSSDSPYARPTQTPGSSLSDFDDPSPSGPSSNGSESNGSSNTPSTSGPSHSGGGSPVSGLSSPSPQSTPTSGAASSGGTSSSPGGGPIGTQIDGLTASAPTQSNSAPTPTADTAPAGSGGRSDSGGSGMPTSPTAPSAGGAVPGGGHHGPGASAGAGATSATSPNPHSGPARNPSASTPGTPSATGTGSASTPSPTSPTTPRSTPASTPDGRIPGTADARTSSTPDGRIPSQRPGGTTPGDGGTTRTTPGTTPGDRTPPRDAPGTTPGDRTTPRNTTDPTGTRTPGQNPTSSTSQNPNQTAPSQTPAQSSPSRTASPSTSTPTTSPSPSTGSAPHRASTPGSSTPSSSTPGNNTPNSSAQPGPVGHGPASQGAPGTPNQPSAGSTPTKPPHQPVGSTPNTPNQPGSTQPNTQQPPANTPNQQQQPQAIPVPVHHVVTTPNNQPQQSTPQTPDSSNNGGSSQQNSSDNPRPKETPTPASETRNTNPPGGVADPTRAEQDALENSVPRDENGDPTRPPDPADGPWVQHINGEGRDAPGRNNNCVDTALSTVDTYAGNPTAAGARTPDLDADGNPSDRGEKGGRDRIENTLGARFSDMGNGRDAFNRLENTLRDSGHGSQAVIITQDSNGRAHAWNAVNHNGKITYIDAQTGQQSSKPLHSGDNGVFAIPLDSNRQPVAADQRADDGTQPQREASETPTGADRRAPDEPAGTDPDETGNSPDDEGDKPKTGTDPERLGSTPFDEDQKPDHRHYGVAGDQAQRDFRAHRDIRQIDLDPVYDTLRDFANNDNAGLRDLLDGSRDGTTWNRDDLANRIPGFNDLNRGQQAAAVGVLARLSNDFHMNQGVGASPYRREGDQSAYRWSESEDATEAREAHRKRDINRQTNFPGNDGEKFQNSRAAVAAANGKPFSEVRGSDSPSANPAQRTRQYLDETYDESVAQQIVDATKDMKPNFLGRNFAVMEVYDPDTKQTHYVADSSFNYVGPRPDHSEPHLGGWIERLNEDRAAKGQNPLVPAHLYTEREPCGHPSESRGHADCGGYIRAYLPEEMGTTYATAYRKGEQVEPFSDGREGVNNAAQAMEVDFQDHLNKVADILKAYALPTPTSPA